MVTLRSESLLSKTLERSKADKVYKMVSSLDGSNWIEMFSHQQE